MLVGFSVVFGVNVLHFHFQTYSKELKANTSVALSATQRRDESSQIFNHFSFESADGYKSCGVHWRKCTQDCGTNCSSYVQIQV